jgi:long-chain acyl-CoA synthetase
LKANTYQYPDFDKFNTFPKLLNHRSEIMPDEVALRNKDLGIWNEITWSDYNKIVFLITLHQLA